MGIPFAYYKSGDVAFYASFLPVNKTAAFLPHGDVTLGITWAVQITQLRDVYGNIRFHNSPGLSGEYDFLHLRFVLTIISVS